MMNVNKTFENFQQLGKQWGEYSRRVSRDALKVMSGQLETAARYLDDLSHRVDPTLGGNGHAGDGSAAASGEVHTPSNPDAN